MNRLEERLAPLDGIAAVILWVAGVVVLQGPAHQPHSDASGCPGAPVLPGSHRHHPRRARRSSRSGHSSLVPRADPRPARAGRGRDAAGELDRVRRWNRDGDLAAPRLGGARGRCDQQRAPLAGRGAGLPRPVCRLLLRGWAVRRGVPPGHRADVPRNGRVSGLARLGEHRPRGLAPDRADRLDRARVRLSRCG